MIELRSIVDPKIAEVLARGQGKDFVNLLRRSVRARAKPALAAAKAATPVKTGRLQASLGIMGLTTPSEGTVSAVIMPRDEFSFNSVAPQRTAKPLQGPDITSKERATYARALRSARKHLVISAKTKQARIDQAMVRGRTIDSSAPYLYAFGIETGKRADGTIARKAGGAKMLERGTNDGSAPFIRDVPQDAFDFITTGSASV